MFAKKMSMQISNGSYYSNMFSPPKVEVPIPKPKLNLSSSMIQRIHNIRPGCGSCGGK